MKVLVTAGPTREYFDPVRYFSNASSGRMGYAVAQVAGKRGHQVILVTGPVALRPPDVTVVPVVSAAEMLEACLQYFPQCEAAVMTAAVADWRPAQRLSHKAAKSPSDLTITLKPTPDICAALGDIKGNRALIGFAVQDDDPHRRAEQKMRAKGCDAMVLNSTAAIGAAVSTLQTKVRQKPWCEPVTAPKEELAVMIVELAENLVRRGVDTR